MRSLPRNTILLGDVRKRLAVLPSASVDTVITSPPYFGVRNYGDDRQLGAEQHVDAWVSELREVARELARILRPTGSLWLNLGDSYSRRPAEGAPTKSLLLGSSRVALALVTDGWVLRNEVLLQHYSNPGTYLTHIEPAVKLSKRILANQAPRDKEAGITHRRFRQLRPEEVDELVDAYHAGATAKELGGQFGINAKTVGKHLRDRGVDTTPPGLAPELVPEAIWLYEKQGWSTERIAVKFATSARTIRSRLLEAGVKMRDTHGREK